MANDRVRRFAPAETHHDRVPPKRGILIYGDPHGEWRPLLDACAAEAPAAVIILGDCDLAAPLHEQIAPVFEAGIDVRWIPGNHDARTSAAYDRLWGDHPDGNLHATAADIGGVAVAGLGGVFKQRVWYPRAEEAEPHFTDRGAYLRQVKPAERWRAGLPLSARDAIFPEDVAALSRIRADVLVTHEAPSCHKYGFAGIDAAVAACRARLVVHGHHHANYDGVLPGGVRVKGLGKAEVFRVNGVIARETGH